MLRKVFRIGIVILCFCMLFRVFFWDDLVSTRITYAEFEEKLLSSQFERITINKEDGKAMLYERSSDNIYELEMISFEKTEELILAQQKAELDSESGNVLRYNIEKESVGFGSFLFSCFMSYIVVSLLILLFRLIRGFNNFKVKVNGRYIKPNSSKSKDKESSEDGEEESPDEIERILDSFKNSIENLDGGFKVTKEAKTDVTFKDVIGIERELDELRDVVDFIASPERYHEAGAKLPKGILLHGKSGVGKTLIARAIAGEADVPFFQISASAVQSKWVGGTEENIRKLFREAKAVAPSIIFIDEFDSIAVRRYENNSSPYAASFLNQLLSCMDGFESTDGVVVIAATNYYNMLDNAVIRRGRFDRHIYIHEPDKKARRELFRYYSRGRDVDIESVMEQLVNRTSGFTGADIESMMNEAALLAVRNSRTKIEESDLEEAYRKIIMGSQTSREATPANKKRTAVHEAGHALMAMNFGHEVMEVSIISRGNAAGYSLSSGDENREMTVQAIIEQVKVSLAGRAAERIIYGNVSAGARSDLQHATNYLYQMKLYYGMSDNEDIGLVLTGNAELDKQLVTESADQLQIDLKKYYEETVQFLRRKQHELCALADLVYDQETVTEDELKVYIQKYMR